MAGLLLPILTAYATQAKQSFIRQTRQPLVAQERFLLKLLQDHAQTELGRQFQIGEINSIDQFRDQVPILPYSSYEPYTDRIAQGETNVLNPDPVVYINRTSGSTGKKKQVPVTNRFQQTLRRADLAGVGFALDALHQRNAKFGKALITNCVRSEGFTSGGIEYGPVSVGSIRKGRKLFGQVFALPFPALEVADTVSRHYVCLLFTLRFTDLRGLIANFPMLVLRTCGYLEKYAEELLWDMEHGSIAPWVILDTATRSQLERRLAPAPQRAQYLREVLRSEGRLTPQLAWANLAYVTTACGGTSDFYFQRFPDYLGDTPFFGGVYGSAEATFGVYPDFNTEGSVLAVTSGFYEFLPLDQWHAAHPKTLLPIEVQTGQRYRILTTSYSGFYRYDIGDVIEVVGFYEQTPIIAFRHRHGGLLSAITEKTTEYHVTQVMQALQSEFGLRLDDFCVTLSETEVPSRYLVNIELAVEQTLAQPEAFLDRFEHWMRHFNQRYDQERNQIPPPRLRILSSGSFATVRRRQLDRGMFDSQLKIPHISEDRQFLQGLSIDQEVKLAEEKVAIEPQ